MAKNFDPLTKSFQKKKIIPRWSLNRGVFKVFVSVFFIPRVAAPPRVFDTTEGVIPTSIPIPILNSIEILSNLCLVLPSLLIQLMDTKTMPPFFVWG